MDESELYLALEVIECYKKYGRGIKNNKQRHMEIFAFFQDTRDCILKKTPRLNSVNIVQKLTNKAS